MKKISDLSPTMLPNVQTRSRDRMGTIIRLKRKTGKGSRHLSIASHQEDLLSKLL